MILLLFFVINKLRLRLNELLAKESKQKIPDYVKKYTKDIFEDVLYKWTWVESTNLKFPYTLYQIESFCSDCNCKIAKSGWRDYCPECERSFIIISKDVLIAKVRQRVENNLYKEKNLKE